MPNQFYIKCLITIKITIWKDTSLSKQEKLNVQATAYLHFRYIASCNTSLDDFVDVTQQNMGFT